MSKGREYVRLVMEEGMGRREAARRAGFACGVPSPEARRLLARVQLLKEEPGMIAAVLGDQRRKQAALDAARNAAAQAAAWLEALSFC
jgi:hypothetical protein